MPESLMESISSRIHDLRQVHLQDSETWAERKRLRRGFRKGSDTEKLRTNDSVVLFDFALHLLTSRDIRWVTPQDRNENELRKGGVVERILSSIMYQNNVSRSQRGLPRAERAVGEAALEQAKVVIYKERRGDEFRIDPVDPNTVFERFDEKGLAELVHEFSVDPLWLDDQRASNDPDIWLLPEDHGIKGQVNVRDYWRRNPGGQWQNIVIVAQQRQYQNLGNSGSIALNRVVSENPWEVQYFKGEANTGGKIRFKGNGLLDANSRVYDDYDDFLEKLHLHMKEVLTSPANVSTRGGRPIDPDYVNPNKGDRPIYPSDAAMGESGISFAQIPGLDNSTSLIQNAYEQFIQQGGVNRLFLGNLDFQLSGFAISRFQELTLASIGEVAVGLEFLWSRIGYWVLSSLKNSPPSEQQSFSGFTSSLSNQGYFSDDFKIPGDLPRNLNVAAKVDVAMPNDLTERMNLARMADPSSGAIWGRTAVGTLFHREVPDWQGNIDEIKAQNTQALPQIQLLEVYAGLRAKEREFDMSDNPDDKFRLEVVREEIEQIKAVLSGSQVQNQAQPQGSGNPQQQVQPAEARGQGRVR